MQAVVCETPGVLKLVERPKPEPAPGEVLIAFWAFETDFGKNMGDFDRARTKARGATVLALVTMGACSVIYALIFIASLLGG